MLLQPPSLDKLQSLGMVSPYFQSKRFQAEAAALLASGSLAAASSVIPWIGLATLAALGVKKAIDLLTSPKRDPKVLDQVEALIHNPQAPASPEAQAVLRTLLSELDTSLLPSVLNPVSETEHPPTLGGLFPEPRFPVTPRSPLWAKIAGVAAATGLLGKFILEIGQQFLAGKSNQLLGTFIQHAPPEGPSPWDVFPLPIKTPNGQQRHYTALDIFYLTPQEREVLHQALLTAAGRGPVWTQLVASWEAFFRALGDRTFFPSETGDARYWVLDAPGATAILPGLTPSGITLDNLRALSLHELERAATLAAQITEPRLRNHWVGAIIHEVRRRAEHLPGPQAYHLAQAIASSLGMDTMALLAQALPERFFPLKRQPVSLERGSR